MPTTLTSTGVTFSDGTSQNSKASSLAYQSISIFNASGTWNKPSGCNLVEVAVLGGGGCCGRPREGQYISCGGGGGGGAIIVADAPNLSSSYPVTVGAGGTGNHISPYSGNGNSGGQSKFGNIVLGGGGGGGSHTHDNNPRNGGNPGAGSSNFNSYNIRILGNGGKGGQAGNGNGGQAASGFGGSGGDSFNAPNTPGGSRSGGSGAYTVGTAFGYTTNPVTKGAGRNGSKANAIVQAPGGQVIVTSYA